MKSSITNRTWDIDADPKTITCNQRDENYRLYWILLPHNITPINSTGLITLFFITNRLIVDIIFAINLLLMKTYNLPYDLSENLEADEEPVLIRPYQSGYTTINNKIVLHYNMINLLLKGTKTVKHAEDTATINAGEFLILSAGNILTSEVLPQHDVFTSVTIYFTNAILTDFFLKYAALIPEKINRKNWRPFLSL